MSLTTARRVRWKDARAALQRLMQDPEETERAFEIVEALAGNQPQRLLRRIRRAPGGGRLLRERPVFDRSTCDLQELAKLPEGTFGHAFATWMLTHQFTPGLMDREVPVQDPEIAYLGKRLTQMHDFWHVLTGYNRDPIGELGVLAFTFGQTGSRGIGFIIATVAWHSVRENWRTARRPWSPLLPYLWRGYRAGRRAQFLPPMMLEELLPVALDSVRTTLGIEPLARSFSPEALPPIAAPAA